MDRGALRALVQGSQRVGHNSAHMHAAEISLHKQEYQLLRVAPRARSTLGGTGTWFFM